MRVSSAAALAVAFSLSACGSTTLLDTGTQRSADHDGAVSSQDASYDATTIAPDGAVMIDAGFDAGLVDASVLDAGSDAGSDAGIDASSDAGSDAAVDASADAGPDASTDAGQDAGVDAGPDAGACVLAGFAPEVTYAFGDPYSSHSTFVTTGDFNHDGSLDLAATNAGGPPDNVGIYLNNGDGTFASEVEYACGTWPGGIVASDFDSDGFLDIAVPNGKSFVAILRNLGDGTFASPLFVSTGGNVTRGIAAGDMNGDRRPDLIVTNYATGAFSVILNRDGHSFDPPTLYDFTLPDSVALGDLDGNGSLDVVVGAATYYAAQFATYFNDGSGALVAGTTYTYGAYDISHRWTPSLVVDDFDGSGHLDILTSTYGGLVVLYPNAGDGTFATPAAFDAGGPVWALVATDFDGDGALDLATPTAVFGSSGNLVETVNVLSGDGHGAFAAPVSYTDLGPTNGITAGDFNHDGRPDIGVGNESWVSVLLSECR